MDYFETNNNNNHVELPEINERPQREPPPPSSEKMDLRVTFELQKQQIALKANKKSKKKRKSKNNKDDKDESSKSFNMVRSSFANILKKIRKNTCSLFNNFLKSLKFQLMKKILLSLQYYLLKTMFLIT